MILFDFLVWFDTCSIHAMSMNKKIGKNKKTIWLKYDLSLMMVIGLGITGNNFLSQASIATFRTDKTKTHYRKSGTRHHFKNYLG